MRSDWGRRWKSRWTMLLADEADDHASKVPDKQKQHMELRRSVEGREDTRSKMYSSRERGREWVRRAMGLDDGHNVSGHVCRGQAMCWQADLHRRAR